jgi:hypothetical protein
MRDIGQAAQRRANLEETHSRGAKHVPEFALECLIPKRSDAEATILKGNISGSMDQRVGDERERA